MKDFQEESYKRYKRYQHNRYRYKQEQILFPLTIIAVITAILTFWKQIIIGISIALLFTIAFLTYKKYKKKRMYSQQPLVLTKEEAQEGVEFEATIQNTFKPITVNVIVPSGTKNGQKIVVKNVLLENNNGKKEKKNIHFKIIVQ